MIKRLCLFLLLSACAMQEEVMEEPIVAEDIASAHPAETCGDDDGIGGTGCEPVARQRSPF